MAHSQGTVERLTGLGGDLEFLDPVQKTSTGDRVWAQLAENYPPDSIAWVKRATWRGPLFIPWSQIDHDDMDKWAASHQPGHVDHFARRIRVGDHPHPVVLVEDPDGNYIDVDGHHRALAYRKLGLPIRAWVGRIDPADRQAMEETHLDQVHEGADPLNKGWGDAWVHELRGPHGEWVHGVEGAGGGSWVHTVPDPVNEAGAIPGLSRTRAGLQTLGGMAARHYAQYMPEMLPRPALGRLFSKWDLASYPERVAAERDGAGWYQQLAHVIAGASRQSPHGTLLRGLSLPAVPQKGDRLPIPISDWSEDPETARLYESLSEYTGGQHGARVMLHLPPAAPAMDAHALGDEAPMSRWLAGGGDYRVAHVEGNDVWLEAAPGRGPVSHPEPPPVPPPPRPAPPRPAPAPAPAPAAPAVWENAGPRQLQPGDTIRVQQYSPGGEHTGMARGAPVKPGETHVTVDSVTPRVEGKSPAIAHGHDPQGNPVDVRLYGPVARQRRAGDAGQLAQAAGDLGAMMTFDPGVSPAVREEVATALSRISPENQRKLIATGALRKIHIVDAPNVDGQLGGSRVGTHIPDFVTAGFYDPVSREFYVAGKSIAARKKIVTHEAMHALDKALGYPSRDAEWRRLVPRLAAGGGKYLSDHFDPKVEGTQVAAQEMWAELAALTTQRRTLTLFNTGFGTLAAMNPGDTKLEADVKAYFKRLGVVPAPVKRKKKT